MHYKMMLGKYDFGLYFPIIKDIRGELLNTMKTIYFNIPKQSKVLSIPDMDVYVDKQIELVQAFTLKYLKILYHKYAKTQQALGVGYKAPHEHDRYKSDMYHMF